eukprot:CAMPEP_0202043314 /NCGR_PEP_ID=MMETSP0962-20130828/29885_1 /ASSEMBLY_ACC=CAM_ASM_000488 /TAXON_ID=4773 /ORGANISM="Schizochytrium aggregatum, Strain ATCC28209" /LENGTH=56 /DNA_ID=CAMNT_0048607781 /DNA_START=1 /DNA_END=168 /DNA_ORIENTATION=-
MVLPLAMSRMTLIARRKNHIYSLLSARQGIPLVQLRTHFLRLRAAIAALPQNMAVW